MREDSLIMIARDWTKQYTKNEVEIILMNNCNYTSLEKDKLLYYFNCYNECDEVSYPYGEK